MGDSFTFGVTSRLPAREIPGGTFVSKLEYLLAERYPDQRFSLTNAGVPGLWMEEIEDRYPAGLRQSDAQVVILQGGANDLNAVGARAVNDVVMRFERMTRDAQGRGVAVILSGVVALMLEANPQLTWRDVRHILAQTARKIDPAFPGRSATDVIPNQRVVLEQGWVTNKAGWTFSNWYGFGAIDALAAVATAKSYTAYLPPIREANPYLVVAPAPQVVPALTLQGYPVTYQVAEPFNTVEYVTVFVNIDQTPIAGCNQIELTSPSGTKSILLHGANGFQNIALPNVRFLSNAFYGEPINGNWTLRFLDLCGFATPTVLSATQPQVLLLSGH